MNRLSIRKKKVKFNVGILIGIVIGTLMSLSFFSFAFGIYSKILFELGSIVFWISLITKPVMEFFGVKSIWIIVIVNTLVTSTIFGVMGYFLNQLRKKDERSFRTLILILSLLFILLFYSCHVIINSDW